MVTGRQESRLPPRPRRAPPRRLEHCSRIPGYAQTLETPRRDGARGFYSGQIAADIARTVQQDPAVLGSLTAADLANYRVVVRTPVCGSYRDFEACGMGPPSSGGITVAQVLGMLERFDIAAAGPGTHRSVHLFTQANRLAFADRALYLGDPDPRGRRAEAIHARGSSPRCVEAVGSGAPTRFGSSGHHAADRRANGIITARTKR
jgi:gamma-glutamyltranspeptidase